jgi:hypothetical protein
MVIASYYRGFIVGLAKIAHPITSLQKKGVKFEWTSKCEESFQHLKYLSTNALVLKIANLEESFVVCIDACKENQWACYLLLIKEDQRAWKELCCP